MLLWLSANLGTILVTLVLLAIVTGIILYLRKEKKQGNSTCCGNCKKCPMHTACQHNSITSQP